MDQSDCATDIGDAVSQSTCIVKVGPSALWEECLQRKRCARVTDCLGLLTRIRLNKETHQHPTYPQPRQKTPIGSLLEQEREGVEQYEVDDWQVFEWNLNRLRDKRDLGVEGAVRQSLATAHEDDQRQVGDRAIC